MVNISAVRVNGVFKFHGNKKPLACEVAVGTFKGDSQESEERGDCPVA